MVLDSNYIVIYVSTTQSTILFSFALVLYHPFMIMDNLRKPLDPRAKTNGLQVKNVYEANIIFNTPP